MQLKNRYRITLGVRHSDIVGASILRTSPKKVEGGVMEVGGVSMDKRDIRGQ